MGMLDPHARLLLLLATLLAAAILLWALPDPIPMLDELLERAGARLL